MKKLIIEEKFKKARQILEKNEAMQLEMGTTEYSNVLEKIIKDLQAVKASLRTRSAEGAKHRKESDRIQSAISAIKYLGFAIPHKTMPDIPIIPNIVLPAINLKYSENGSFVVSIRPCILFSKTKPLKSTTSLR